MELRNKKYDLLVITSEDHYDGEDCHGTVQIYKFLKEKVKIDCALICTRQKIFQDIKDSYLIDDYKQLPKHNKILVSDYHDLPFHIAQRLIEKNNSMIYYCGLVHNMYTAGCSYPQEMECDKYMYSHGCYNCKYAATVNKHNGERYDTHMEKGPIMWKFLKQFYADKNNRKNIVYLPVSSFSKNQAKKSFLFKNIKSYTVPLSNTSPCVEDISDLISHRDRQKKIFIESFIGRNEKIKNMKNLCVWNALDARIERKGFSSFIDILHLLKNKYMTEDEFDKTIFAVLGHPEAYEEAVKALPDNTNIFLTGVIGLPMINHLYSAASLYCCTTYEDAGPRTIGEAASNGCPIISYNTCVATDLVSNKSGKIIALKDVDNYAKSIYNILNLEKKQHDDMCIESYKSYNDFYGEEKAIKLWREALNK